MDQISPPETLAPPGPVARLRPVAQWGALLVLTAICAVLFDWLRMPAALLLGPMVAAILLGINGASVRPPLLAFQVSQAVIALLIASTITPAIAASFLREWPLYISVVLAVTAVASFTGWIMTRMRILPGTTAIWGCSPGAATIMMVMSHDFGADARLVAFMHYVRIVLVALLAAIVARWFIDPALLERASGHVWFPALAPAPFGTSLAIIAASLFLNRLLPLPAGYLLYALLIGAVLNVAGLVSFQLPEWLLALAYLIVGWWVGLVFTRQIFMHALRALPAILLSTLLLILFCGLIAWGLVYFLGIDPMTAYLATSPGGMDAIAIISASSGADVPFVMAMQVVRLVLVMFIGASLARFVARHS